MGTAAYMSPEQAKGKVVDKRADIWAFGVVLYELLTGDRLFKGDDAVDTLAQVLTKQPDLEKVPRRARRLVEECLQKNPKQRLRDIGDAKRLLEEGGAESPSPAKARVAWKVPWMAVAGVVAIAAAVAAWAPWRAAVRFRSSSRWVSSSTAARRWKMRLSQYST